MASEEDKTTAAEPPSPAPAPAPGPADAPAPDNKTGEAGEAEEGGDQEKELPPPCLDMTDYKLKVPHLVTHLFVLFLTDPLLLLPLMSSSM